MAGKMEAVQACMYQQHGIGRPMKPGKETVVGAIAAIERWEKTDWDAEQLSLAKRMGCLLYTSDAADDTPCRSRWSPYH